MLSSLLERISLVSAAILISVSLAGQSEIELNGKIFNSFQEPLGDVAVNYYGSLESPVITDTSGMFTISVPSGEVWLNISPVVGYMEKQVFLNDRKSITIYLVENEEESGYEELDYLGNTYRRRDIVSKINTGLGGDKFSNSYESFDQNLQGKVSGMYQTTFSGMPGSGTYMLLRGMNSINSGNQPLIIVDGIPLENPRGIHSTVSGYTYNPAASIDPTDISDLSIVKDGSALSIYGLKGSNGLIFIETLKPVETNTSIEFKYKLGMSFTPDTIPQLNSIAYKTLAKEILSSSTFKEEEYATSYPGLFYTETDPEYIRYSHNTNWQNEIFKNSILQDVYVSVKGGDDIARYGLSVGYLGHNGVIKNTNFNRVSTRFVGTFNIFSRMRMYVSANLVSSTSKYKESVLGNQTSPILSAFHKSPQMFPKRYDQDNQVLEAIDDVDELGISNPKAVVENYSARNSNYRFLTSFKVEGDISKKVKWNSILGLNINDIKEQIYMPNLGMEYYFDKEAYNVSQSLNNLLFMISNDNYLVFKDQIDGVHTISFRGGVRWQTNDYQEDLGISMNSNENDQYTNLGTGDNQLEFITGLNQKWTWLSNYYTGSYIYKDKYLLDAAISADFSSRVGKEAEGVLKLGGQPFGIFYNIGGAWRISNESFMKDNPTIEDLKIRVNYGTSGNDDIGNNNAFKYYTLQLYRETSGMIPGGFANETLKFETTSQFSTGLDLGIMENRLRFSLDYYNSRTRDMLIFEELPAYMGYEVYPSNNASMSNNGYGFSVNSRVFQKSKLSLDIGISASHYNSVITEMADNEIITNIPGGGQIINRVGDQANSFYGYEFTGVYSSRAVVPAGLVNEKGIPFGAGDAIFSDLSGPDDKPDNVINEYDKIVLGSSTPDYYGGVFMDLRYGRYGLHMHWQFVSGNEIYNHSRYLNERMTDLSNQSSAVLNRWIYDGQETNIPRSAWGDPVGNADFSSRWIEDGSHVRLKNLTLSYTIPEKMLFFRDLDLFVTGTNLLTFSKYLSYDPEFSSSFDPMMQGIDLGLMPITRTVMVGVKFGL